MKHYVVFDILLQSTTVDNATTLLGRRQTFQTASLVLYVKHKTLTILAAADPDI